MGIRHLNPIYHITSTDPKDRSAGHRFRAGRFFGNEEANPTPRATQVWSAASVPYPAGATRSQPAMARGPERSNGFAPGSFNIAPVVAGSIRTMRSSPWMPTHMLPPRRKAIPPNNCFSVMSLRPASVLRTRAAWASEYVMRGGRGTVGGFKNHDPIAGRRSLVTGGPRPVFPSGIPHVFLPPPPSSPLECRPPRSQGSRRPSTATGFLRTFLSDCQTANWPRFWSLGRREDHVIPM